MAAKQQACPAGCHGASHPSATVRDALASCCWLAALLIRILTAALGSAGAPADFGRAMGEASRSLPSLVAGVGEQDAVAPCCCCR